MITFLADVVAAASSCVNFMETDILDSIRLHFCYYIYNKQPI